MPALDQPRELLEVNGSISQIINLYEPSVAMEGRLLPSPTSLTENGRTDGPNYGTQTFSRMIDVILDTEGRVITEEIQSEGSKGVNTTLIERAWDGTDFSEAVVINGRDPIINFRRRIDDVTTEVKEDDEYFTVVQKDKEDGTKELEATHGESDQRVISLYDETGRIISQTTLVPGKKPVVTTYEYDSEGTLLREVRPGYMYIGGSKTPLDVHTTYEMTEKEDSRLVVVKRLPFPDSPNNPEMTQRRRYDKEGQYLGSETVDGFIDIGRLITSQTIEFSLMSVSTVNI
jgi:hypothetical protein